MKKRKKKLSLFNKIIIFLFNLIIILDLIFIKKLNILPLKYLTIIFGFILLILLIFNILLTRRKKKKTGIYIFTVILIIIFGFVFKYLLDTVGFFNGFGKKNYKEEVYSVIVLKESHYNELDDLQNKKIGIFNSNEDSLNKVIEKIQKEIKFNKVEYSSTDTLFKDLLAKKVEAILIKEAYLDLIYEDNYDYKDLIKVIKNVSIKTKLNNKHKAVDVTNEFFNIYISGIDTYGNVNKTSRSDVNIVVSINPKTKKVLISSVPRDYYVALANKEGLKDKLTHAGIYGVDTSMQTLANLLDTKIDYYIKINFSSLINIVDVMGGIEVNSNYNFTTIDNVSFKKGINKLDGKKALSFARERHAFDSIGGDRIRGENQQLIIKALIDKALSPSILAKYNGLMKSLEKSFVTNIPEEYVTTLINEQLDKNVTWDIDLVNLNGKDAKMFTYSYPHQKLYVMVPDEKSVIEAQEKIDLLEN